MSNRQPPRIAACALRVAPGDALVRLIPAGRFDAPAGALAGAGPWQLSEPAARAIIARAALRSADIVIDYEHQTLLAERNGQPAPAAGWIDAAGLEWRADGLYGPVRWTAAASAAIDADEYRYLSPVFVYDPDGGEVLDLLHVALTNTPALNQERGAAALAAARRVLDPQSAPFIADPTTEEPLVDNATLIALLGLADGATEDDIKAAIAALQESQVQLQAVRQALGMGETDDAAAVVAALKASGATAPTGFVPRAVYEEAQAQIAALRTGGDQAEIDRLIEDGLAAGRIPGKATADWLRGQGLAALKGYLADAPAIAALGATQTGGRKPDGDAGKPGALSQEEAAVCKAMGISPEAYRQANA